MKTTIRALLVGSTLLLSTSTFGCGGASKPAADPASASASTSASTPASAATSTSASAATSTASDSASTMKPATAEPRVERLAIGAAKVTVVYDQKARAEISIAADGEITADVDGASGKKKPMKKAFLNTDGTFMVEGKTIAKLDDAGTLSFLSESIQRMDGKVVKSESKWEPAGTLDVDGTFTATKDGKKLVVGADGKVVGFPKELEATIEAADPAHRRAAMIMVIAMFAGGRSESDISSSTSAPAVIAP